MNWISVAAASTLVAAMMTGCGSSSNGTATVTPTTTQPTTLKAVDGYIMNPTVTVAYLDDNNNTVTTTVDNTANEAIIAPSIVAGTGDVTLAELNSSVLENLVYVELGHQAMRNVNGNVHQATFINTDSNLSYNAAEDELAPAGLKLRAPAGYSIVSPITTLIQAAVDSQVTADGNESNRSAIIADVEAKIAAALGLDKDDVKSVDPLTVVDTKPEYAFINAMLGVNNAVADVSGVANSLKAATAATSVAGAFANLAAADGTNTALFDSVKDQVADIDLKTLNFDKVRKDSDSAGAFVPVLNAGSDVDFDVTSVLVNDVNATELVVKGAKITTDTVGVKLGLDVDSDINVSTKTLGFAMKISGEKANVAGDANATEITIYVPVEVNATEGTIATAFGDKISYEAVTPAGVVKTGTFDSNSTVLSFTAPSIASDVLSVDLAGIASKIDDNLTGTGTVDIIEGAGNIANLQLVVVDEDSAFQKVSGTSPVYWGSSTVTSIGATINKTGNTILNLAPADFRVSGPGSTRENNAPALTSVTPQTDNDPEVVFVSAAGAIAQNEGTDVQGGKIVINEGSGKITDIYQVVSSVNGDTGEDNNTIKISGLPSFASVTKDTFTTNTADFNLTLDGNATVTGHGAKMAKISFTDEFGKTASANDGNVTFMFNHKPVITAGTVSIDLNTTSGAEHNSTLVSDSDGIADLNSSATGGLEAVTIVTAWTYDNNPMTVGAAAVADVNATATHSVDIGATLNPDGSVKWGIADGTTRTMAGVGNEGNVTITYNVTDIYGATSADKNITFDINTTE